MDNVDQAAVATPVEEVAVENASAPELDAVDDSIPQEDGVEIEGDDSEVEDSDDLEFEDEDDEDEDEDEDESDDE